MDCPSSSPLFNRLINTVNKIHNFIKFLATSFRKWDYLNKYNWNLQFKKEDYIVDTNLFLV